MKLTRCPVCHEHISLTCLVQDEAGRELLAMLAKLDTLSGAALVTYLALFRSSKRDLANDRALRLARELEELANGDWVRLAVAMSATVERMREKGNAKPFANHNYLKKVFEEVPADVSSRVTVMPAKAQQNSKLNSAFLAIDEA